MPASQGEPGPRRPRGDDRPFWDLVAGIYGAEAVLVAHDLKLFPLLARGTLTLEEICGALKIARRPAAAVAAGAGFVSIEVLPTFGYWGVVTGHKP